MVFVPPVFYAQHFTQTLCVGFCFNLSPVCILRMLQRALTRQSRALWVSAGRDGERRGNELRLATSILSRNTGHTESGKPCTLEGL